MFCFRGPLKLSCGACLVSRRAGSRPQLPTVPGPDTGSWAGLPYPDHRCGWHLRLLGVAAAELVSVIVASVLWMKHPGSWRMASP
jgi:hypothetical protein